MHALVVTMDGFEDSECEYPRYRLIEAGVDVTVATPDGDAATGKHGATVPGDAAIDDRSASEWADAFDLLVVPGGRAPERLRVDAPRAADVVAAFDDAGRPIAAICHGPQLLVSADVLDGRRVTADASIRVDVENAGATVVDEAPVVDDNLVTARTPDDLPGFMRATIEVLDPEHEHDRTATPA